MRTRRLLHLPQRALAWLLLVLLLPLAQAVAAAHAVSHLAGGEDLQDKQALHAAHCALCSTAATVSAGAPPAVPADLPLLDLGHETPLPVAAGVHRAAPTPAYRSRAPPAFTH
ncbi:hypothetical protein [Azohydromonas caseinilytica]|uniref:DUF2946 domain-containing protein n=1 Tax=Azohydromonas caseinilytica TaxID=2728836 RepID=A0A848FBG6_9BURK|nr:hypothetical protein [Azohydromonas caseinilytica]NML15663.1 hypothetical protein [Azohydromonas caseinilytica]